MLWALALGCVQLSPPSVDQQQTAFLLADDEVNPAPVVPGQGENDFV
jgi:hypothetical protein